MGKIYNISLKLSQLTNNYYEKLSDRQTILLLSKLIYLGFAASFECFVHALMSSQ